MAQDYNTAEKELLRAIEGKGKGSKLLIRKYRRAGIFSLLKGKISQYRQRLFSEEGRIRIEEVNLWLKVILCIVGLWWGMVFLQGINRFKNIPQFDLPSIDVSSYKVETIPSFLEPDSYYIELVMNRNIFLPFEKKKIKKQPSPLPDINKMVKGLHLVGVSWSDNVKERFVMIEDTEKKITYYLREGEKILNLTIKRIYPDKVIISYKNEEVVLR